MRPLPLRRFFRLLNLNCADASALVSQALDTTLPRAEQTAVALHLAICSPCRRSRQQFKMLRQVFAYLGAESRHLPGLPSAERERIKHTLRSENDRP